jgi:hypothetical protein
VVASLRNLDTRLFSLGNMTRVGKLGETLDLRNQTVEFAQMRREHFFAMRRQKTARVG